MNTTNSHTHLDSEMHGHNKKSNDNNHSGHSHMIEDFKKRFYISVVITIPIIILIPMIQHWLGIPGKFSFTGDMYVLFALSSFVYFYGGFPFLKGMYDELKILKPGMMTLIAVAITVAYVYSSIVVYGLKGDIFFWELATLIDIMLVGHWIEMKSVMGASKALEELARLMPSDAHKIQDNGSMVDVPLDELKINDKVLVKPGEKFPADGIILKGETSANESMDAVRELREMGVKSIMLTGDNKQVAKWVADEIGMDEYFAEVLPGEKAIKIKEVQQRGLIIAMTGDGVNDAPALAQADVGIAIGAGTDVAIETADIILIRSNPQDVVSIIKLSRATYSKMVQNLIWATGYNLFAIPLAADVLYSMVFF